MFHVVRESRMSANITPRAGRASNKTVLRLESPGLRRPESRVSAIGHFAAAAGRQPGGVVL